MLERKIKTSLLKVWQVEGEELIFWRVFCLMQKKPEFVWRQNQEKLRQSAEKRKALERRCEFPWKVILWASPPSLETAAPGRLHMIMVIYHVRQKRGSTSVPASLPSPLGDWISSSGTWVALGNHLLSTALGANEIESSEPLRERGYPDSGPTIVLIISMGAKQSRATQFPRFLQDDQARLQGLKATSLSLIFHPLPGATVSFFHASPPSSGPLQSHPQLSKGAIKISEGHCLGSVSKLTLPPLVSAAQIPPQRFCCNIFVCSIANSQYLCSWKHPNSALPERTQLSRG